MQTPNTTPGFDTARAALVVYLPTTAEAADRFVASLAARQFDTLLSASTGGRNEEQTRALVLVSVAEIAAQQACTVAALAAMGIARLSAEHSVEGRTQEQVDQACQLATRALDVAFDARTAVKAAIVAAEKEAAAAQLAATTAAAAAAATPPPATEPPVAPAAVVPVFAPPADVAPAPVAVDTPPPVVAPVAPSEPAAVETPPAPAVEVSPVAEPAAAVSPATTPAPPPTASTPTPAEPTKPKRPTLSGN